MKFLFSLFIINILFSLQAPAQEPVLSKVDNTIHANKIRLKETSLTAEDREKIFREIAHDLNTAAEIHFNKAAYEKATKLFVEADAFTRQFHESLYLRYKQQLTEAVNKLTEYNKEQEGLKKETLYKGGRILVSGILSQLIDEANYLSEKENEKLYLQKLITVSKELKDSKGEAKAYEKLGEIEVNENHPEKALEFYNKAFALRKNDNEEWWTLDYIAYAHRQIGNFKKASELFQQEIYLLNKLQTKPVPNTTTGILEQMSKRSSLASAYFNIAQLRMLQGKFGEATKAVNRVDSIIKILELQQKENKDETVNSLLTLTIYTHKATLNRTLGRILEAQGKDDAALQKYLIAIDLFSQLSGGKPSGAIATLRGRISLLFMKQKKFDEARANIKEVLRLRARLQQQTGTVYALIYASRIEREAKKNEAALQFAKQAISSAKQLKFSEDVLAEASETHADVLVDNSEINNVNIAQAIQDYKFASNTYRKLELLPSLTRCLNSLGWAYEKAGNIKEAEKSYAEAIKITESIQSSFETKAESENYGNRDETAELYKRMVDLLIKQGRTTNALEYATRAQRKDLIDAFPKNEIKLQGKSNATLNAATTSENRINALRGNGEQNKTAGSETSKQNQLASALGNARQQYALAIKKLEVEQPGLHFTVRPIDLLKLQSSIASTEAVVSYLITANKLYLFVINRSSVSVKTVDINEKDLKDLVDAARKGLNEFGNNFYAISMDSEKGFAEEKIRSDVRSKDTSAYYKKILSPVNIALTKLYQTLISPAEDLLKDVKTLKIIPNGSLFLLPFTALISPVDNQYLIEKHDVIFLTAGDLINTLNTVTKGTMVAFGNPTEADLEGALEEVKAIQSVYPGTKIYTEDAATKAQLFKVTAAKILHLATHGHILSPLESSNIQLAHLPGLEDPDLTYGEIYALPIENMEMVVLSACQTALGTVSGTEIGVFIEAFRTKAKTVVASLWSVDDMATKILMTEFYKNLHLGKTRAASMRSAQLKLITDKRTKNPLFWAAFVLYGDGGKL